MFSQRGLVSLAHSHHEMQTIRRRVYAIHLNGIDSEFLTPAELKALCPIINVDPKARFPIVGGSLVSTPVTLPFSTLRPVTSQFWMMSTPRESAARA